MPAEGDRRVRRTRKALHEAFLALLVEKGYDAITVQDIIDRADVGRSTFYSHFSDKRDLMRSGLDELSVLLTHREPAHAERPGHLFGFSRAMFQHTHDQQHLVRALVARSGADPVQQRLQRVLGDTVRAELDAVVARTPGARRPDELIVAYVVGAFLALVSAWLHTAPDQSPDEIDNLFTTLITPGLRAALRLSRPPPRPRNDTKDPGAPLEGHQSS